MNSHASEFRSLSSATRSMYNAKAKDRGAALQDENQSEMSRIIARMSLQKKRVQEERLADGLQNSLSNVKFDEKALLLLVANFNSPNFHDLVSKLFLVKRCVLLECQAKVCNQNYRSTT